MIDLNIQLVFALSFSLAVPVAKHKPLLLFYPKHFGNISGIGFCKPVEILTESQENQNAITGENWTFPYIQLSQFVKNVH